MNYIKVLVLSLLCHPHFLSHGMDFKTTQESVQAANIKLLDAVETRDLTEVERLIAEGIADLNTQDENKCTPLILALQQYTPFTFAYGDASNKIALALIAAGADVNITDKNGETALAYAAHKENIKLLNALISAKADVNIRLASCETPLIRAVMSNNINAINVLINAQANVNVRNGEDTTILNLAVEKYNAVAVQLLTNKGSTQKDAALLFAIDKLMGKDPYFKQKCYKIINVLIQAGANPNTQDKYQSTPLIKAAGKNDTDLALALIKANVDINTANHEGKTALIYAIAHFNPKLITALIEKKANFKGALCAFAYNKYNERYDKDYYIYLLTILIKTCTNLNEKDSYGDTPLIIASEYHNNVVAKALIEAGADVNIMNKDRNTALLYATQGKNITLAKALINSGADANITNEDNESAFKCFISNNDIESINALIEAKANCNIALYYAALCSDTSLLKTLIKACTNLNEANSHGITALMIATMHNKTDNALVLIENGADVNIISEYDGTALFLAVHKNNTELINALLKAGADLNSVTKYSGETVLVRAIKDKKDISLINLLIKAGADVDICNKDGVPALALAINSNKPEISMALINPTPTPDSRKRIITLLACSTFATLPQDVLKIIITCAHPEYAIDRELLRDLHPQELVDNVPLETLSMLIKDEVLNQDSILGAWQKKITSIVQSLKSKYVVDYNAIQKFETDALTKITLSLTK